MPRKLCVGVPCDLLWSTPPGFISKEPCDLVVCVFCVCVRRPDRHFSRGADPWFVETLCNEEPDLALRAAGGVISAASTPNHEQLSGFKFQIVATNRLHRSTTARPATEMGLSLGHHSCLNASGLRWLEQRAVRGNSCKYWTPAKHFETSGASPPSQPQVHRWPGCGCPSTKRSRELAARPRGRPSVSSAAARFRRFTCDSAKATSG